MKSGVFFSTVFWLFGLYFIEGLPNAIVNSLSVAYYNDMGMSNTSMAMLTSFLGIPWVIKGFWGPLVDSVSTKRRWIFFCSGIFCLCFLGLVLAQFISHWLVLSAIFFLILGFASATFDISADGFYMLSLDLKQQSFFVGIRNAFYRIATLFGQGAMLILAGWGIAVFNNKGTAWALSFGVCALIVALCMLFFKMFLPYPATDIPKKDSSLRDILVNIKNAFFEFFQKKQIFSILFFVLFYRFAEAQLVRIVQPFMKASRESGGLGMNLLDIGFIYGTCASVFLFIGGILGGFLISRVGLKKSMLPMALMMNLPNLIYVYMAYLQPESMWLVGGLIGFEQFGYGFGFAAYMVYLMRVSRGENMTSSYAICTSLMALGVFLSGFFSGALQELMGYLGFFSWIIVATSVSFLATWVASRTVEEEKA